MGGLFEIRLIRTFAIEFVVATIIASIRKCRLRLRLWRSLRLAVGRWAEAVLSAIHRNIPPTVDPICTNVLFLIAPTFSTAPLKKAKKGLVVRRRVSQSQKVRTKESARENRTMERREAACLHQAASLELQRIGVLPKPPQSHHFRRKPASGFSPRFSTAWSARNGTAQVRRLHCPASGRDARRHAPDGDAVVPHARLGLSAEPDPPLADSS